ncbi:MAG TPA: DUF1844 domain-containing protein [Verrucomicrobiota bacterium]|nr:hypothetical protein [Verrucomicrobiales bacterium]HRI12997.1 DUF1844 domain-containing protein [Verrucomicrobiota bacterium]
MNPTPLNEDSLSNATPEQIHSALFAQFVTHHAQMTMMLLGKYPNPASGQLEPANLEASKHFIDQLEMIEAKTKGNLTPDESRLLRQMLSATRLTFAEVVDAQVTEPTPPAASPAEPAPPTEPAAPPSETTATDPAAADDESKVKFSKKY